MVGTAHEGSKTCFSVAASQDWRQAIARAPHAATWRRYLTHADYKAGRILEALHQFPEMSDPQKYWWSAGAFCEVCYIASVRPEYIEDQQPFEDEVNNWPAAATGKDHESADGLAVGAVGDQQKRLLREAIGLAWFGLQDEEQAVEFLQDGYREWFVSYFALAALCARDGSLEQAERYDELGTKNLSRGIGESGSSRWSVFYQPIQQAAEERLALLRGR